MKLHKLPNLLVNSILIQLTINQVILILIQNSISVNAEHHHHLNYHRSYGDQLNHAIYNQLLSIEPTSTDSEIKKIKNSKIESMKQINRSKQTDLIVQKNLNTSTNINNHSNSPISNFINNKSIDYSDTISHSIFGSVNLTDPLKSKNSTSINRSNDKRLIEKQFDTINDSQQFDSNHQLIVNNNSSVTDQKSTKSVSFESSNSESSSKSRSVSNDLKTANINHSFIKTNSLKNRNDTNFILTNHHLSKTIETMRSRSARSSNNPKLTELVRRNPCTSNKDCVFSNICDFSQNMCKCPQGYINVKDLQDQKDVDSANVNWPPTHCYQAQQLEKSCIYDEQCIVKHSKCTRDENLGQHLHCACTLGYASKGKVLKKILNMGFRTFLMKFSPI